MSAYLCTFIYGNESFGGYFSVDGEKSRAIEDDMTYQLEPGPHRIEIFSTSNAERAAGKFQAAVYSNTSSSGAVWDSIERNQAIKNLGDSWSFDVFVEENQCVFLRVRTSGRSIVADPMYEVTDLTDEQIERLETTFKKIEEQRIIEKNTPRRSVPKIVWGSILMGIGGLCVLTVLGEMAGGSVSEPSALIAPLVVLGGLAIGGLLLFIDGRKKKIR